MREKATAGDFSAVQIEGCRKVNRTVKHYSLEAIVAVGLSVKNLKNNNANTPTGMYGGI